MHSNTHRHRLPASLAVYAISCLSALAAPCTLQPDTTATHLQLQELTVSGDSGTGTRVRSDGSIEIALGRVAGMIQAFGEDDVMRHLKMMPGIEGNSDYSSGISVDGTDFSHSVCRIGGAPVFFPYHFGGSNTTSGQSHLTFSSLHLSLAAECEIRLSEALSLSPWCKVSAYSQGSYHAIDAQPGATLNISRNENFLTLALGRAVQHLHQVGLSEIGMASNFWIPSTSAIKPQKAWSATAQWVRPLPQGRLGRFRLSAHAYARLLTNAHEYSGDLLSLITSDYRATDHIITGKGYAWGLGTMLSHESNRLSGWASYAFGVSRLRFPSISHKMNPSSLDPGHSFTIFGRYKLSRRLHGSASWHIASGRRITPITQIYIIADKVMTEHGERNCAHLPTYHRLDLSLIYHFTTSTPCSHHPLQHQLSFTLFNAYGKRNVEMQTFVINPTTGNYHLKSPKSLYHFLPSLSYAISF